MPEAEVAQTLNARGNTHGDARVQFSLAQYLKKVLRGDMSPDTEEEREIVTSLRQQYADLDPVTRECLDMILHKITHIVVGQEDFVDHWHDMQGYAKLAEERVCRKL